MNWELSILSRSVAYPNLSGAALHVGLSQSQLSRIVARLEERMDVRLLDREARRKSAWTPDAFRLSEIYVQAERRFHGNVQELIQGAQVSHLRLGALEGMLDVAMKLARQALLRSGSAGISGFKGPRLRVLELDILDLDELEKAFSRGDLDLILTSRQPGAKKRRYEKKLGVQTLDAAGTPGGIRVMSSFEFGSRKKTDEGSVLVSNSLEVRRRWIQSHGGHGVIPSSLRKEKGSRAGEVPVLLLASDQLPSGLWEALDLFQPG